MGKPKLVKKAEMMDVVKKAELPNVIKKAKRQEQAMMENEAEPRASPAWSRRPKLIKEAELMDMIKKAEKQELVKSKKDELMDVTEGAEDVIKKVKKAETQEQHKLIKRGEARK